MAHNSWSDTFLMAVFYLVGFSQPALLAAMFAPYHVRSLRIPGRYMDAVRDVANGHLVGGPAGEQGLEDAPAHFPVQLADAIDRATAAQGQICHVEGFLVVVGILSS